MGTDNGGVILTKQNNVKPASVSDILTKSVHKFKTFAKGGKGGGEKKKEKRKGEKKERKKEKKKRKTEKSAGYHVIIPVLASHTRVTNA